MSSKRGRLESPHRRAILAIMSSNPYGANPNGPTLQGIDVAYPQGKSFDWQKVSEDGIRFAWIKATGVTDEGIPFVDSCFRRNWKESKAHGVLRGSYHFLAPDHDPIEQAKYHLGTIGDLEDDDMHCMLDIEVMHGCTSDRVIGAARDWIDYVEENLGREVVIYTFPSFWKGLGEPKAYPFTGRKLFIAHYCVHPTTGQVFDLKEPMKLATWERWWVWQVTGNIGPRPKGDSSPPRIPGIPFDVDRDVFWGTEDQFRAHLTRSGPGMLPADSPRPFTDAASRFRAGEGEHDIDD